MNQNPPPPDLPERPKAAQVANIATLNMAAVMIRDLHGSFDKARALRNRVSADLSMLGVMISLLRRSMAGCGRTDDHVDRCQMGRLCSLCRVEVDRHVAGIAFPPDPDPV